MILDCYTTVFQHFPLLGQIVILLGIDKKV